MSGPVLLCVDGSSECLAALAAGRALLAADSPFELVAALAPPDVAMVTGTGFAGGLMSPEELDREDAAAVGAVQADLAAAAEHLALPDAPKLVVRGSAGPGIVAVAEQRGAAAIVIGSRGRGGVKRFVLGSVSDHVVRHAPCPVIVTNPAAAGGE